MERDAYTLDAICQSLGVGDFGEAWSKGALAGQLRLLLCPAFDPEVFVSLSDAGDTLVVSVAAARSRIRQLADPGPVTIDGATVDLPGLTFHQVEGEFRLALGQGQPDGAGLDGMSVYALLHTPHGTVSLRQTPFPDDLMGRFLATIIGRIYVAADLTDCRNALARIGRYVGLDLDVAPEAPPLDVTNLVVLGDSEEQEAFLAAIAAVSAPHPRDP